MISLTGLLIAIVIGILAGWLAGVLVRGGGFGLLADLVLGAVGAVIGNFLLGAFGFNTYGFIGDLASAVIGAVLLLLLIRLIKRE